MRILLTGATGFVGSALAQHLRSRGHELVGVHARPRGSAGGGSFQDVVLDIGSRSNVDKLRADIPPCDAIIHAAAALDMGLFAPGAAHVNCAGVQNLLWLGSQWRARRFVFLSSVPVIGVPRHHPVTETHPAEPLTAYHASKLYGEHLVRLARSEGIEGVTLRLTAPVGDRMPRGRLLPVLVSRALNHAPLELSGTGSRKQNYVDVRDVAQAAEACLESDVAGVFNIAGSDCISNLDLAEQCIARCRSSSKISFTGKPDPEDGVAWEVSTEKAFRQLGFVPRYRVGDAIDGLVARMKAE